jgi:hypothetical protein
MTLNTTKGMIGIVRPEFVRMEIEVQGGIARVSQRIELTEAKLVLGYDIGDVQLNPGDTVILRGDAGLQQWAKTEYRLPGANPFVLCPETQILGYRKQDVAVASK